MNRFKFTRKLILPHLLKNESYISETGWITSMENGQCINAKKEPIPWMTYPAISFLQRRVTKYMSVFEYGSGNSTLWWAARVSNIVACEHDKKWFEKMKGKIPSNVELLYFDLIPGGDYSKAITKYVNQFDVIVIDGRDRVNCVKNSLNSLKPQGVVIWDNADREKYSEGYDFLIANSYKRIDFEGTGPIERFSWWTSVFYKENNCFGI
jgi:hypothetical protein